MFQHGVFQIDVGASKCAADPECTYLTLSTVAGLDGLQDNKANTLWLCRGTPRFVFHLGWLAAGKPSFMPPRELVDVNAVFDGPVLA